MMSSLYRILTTLALLAVLSVTLSAQDDDGILYIDAENTVGSVSPLVYGANFGPLQTIPPDLIEMAQSGNINYLRFPGGRWGDQNDIRTQQIDALVRSASLIGAETLSINVRLENGTPEAAAALVRYVNIDNDYDVRLWGIGNEPDLFDDYTTEQYVREWRAIAEAMRAVDPDILLMGPETSQWTGTGQTERQDSWVRAFLEANGDLVDIVAVHRYPFPASLNSTTTVEDLRQNTVEWDTILDNLRETVIEITGRDLPVAITEVNSHWNSAIGGEATNDSHYNAIWWADSLGRLLYDEPYAVAFFDFQSADSRGGTGLLERYEVRPTYFVYQLYGQFGDALQYTESDGDLSLYAAHREDGALTIIVVNLADNPITRSLELDGYTANRIDRTQYMLEGLSELQTLDTIDSYTFPAQSITLFELYE